MIWPDQPESSRLVTPINRRLRRTFVEIRRIWVVVGALSINKKIWILSFLPLSNKYKDLDYVSAWYAKGASYCSLGRGEYAFVATKSICQGEQVAMLWPIIFDCGLNISFAYRPFNWGNLAKSNAGVTCIIVGISPSPRRPCKIYEGSAARQVRNIGPYLINMNNVCIKNRNHSISDLPKMDYGNKPSDGGWLILSRDEREELILDEALSDRFVRKFIGSKEFINSTERYCLWVEDEDLKLAESVDAISRRFNEVRRVRKESSGPQANSKASVPHRFVFAPHKSGPAIIVPRGFLRKSTLSSCRLSRRSYHHLGSSSCDL